MRFLFSVFTLFFISSSPEQENLPKVTSIKKIRPGRLLAILFFSSVLFFMGCGSDGGAGEDTTLDAPVIQGIVSGSFNTAQSFTITGETGADIEYSVNGGTTWQEYTGGVNLNTDGTHRITARQTRSDGKISENAEIITVTIDLTLPAAPVVSGISAGRYNTGQSFTITGEAGAYIEYSIDGGITWIEYTARVNLDTEGTREIIAHQTDTVGNLSANTVVINVLIDFTLPDAPVISGISAGIYNTASFTITGETGADIEYSVDGGTTWFAYTAEVTLDTEDTYNVTARQTDIAGNVSATATQITVTIDKTAEAPVISGISAGIYNTARSFTVTGEAGATIVYSLDGGTSWLTYAAEVTLNTEGIYNVTARQTDIAGNVSATATQITVTIDKTAEAPVISGISAGIYNTARSFTITGETGADIEYSVDGGTTWFVYTAEVDLDTEGFLEITARQRDIAGNVSANVAAINVTIDLTRPDAPVISGISTDIYDTPRSFTITGETGADIVYSLNGGTTWLTYIAEVNLDAEGTYNVTARQTDTAGNLSVNSAVITVEIDMKEVTHFAGPSGGIGSEDGTGADARFNNPAGITTDGTSFYVADSSNHTIRKIVIGTGEVTTLAGTAGLRGSEDGTGADARFYSPYGIATDGTSLYVTDGYNHTIRKIVIGTGEVTTLAGTAGLRGSEDGTGADARFNYPFGIATDGTSLYVADGSNFTIRKIVIATGEVTTLAGTAGSSGSEDGTGADARFNCPSDITTDDTSLYVADKSNHTIRKIVIGTGEVTTLAGTAGSSGSEDGTDTAARFYYPEGITTDGTSLYVADTYNHIIRKIVIGTGEVTTLAGIAGSRGSEDGTGADARFNCPSDIATDGTSLYVADTGNNTIRKIVIATGEVTKLAGRAGRVGSKDGTGFASTFHGPDGITTDGTSLYVADSRNHTIRKIEIATGEVTTLAGTAVICGTTDGIGPAARFYLPRGITWVDSSIFVTDSNHCIRRLD